MTWYMYYCARLGQWVVGSESDVEDARDGGCRGHVVIDTADDDAVHVSTENGFVPASATVSCAAAEGGACAGEAVRVAGTSLYWPGAEGTTVSKTFLEGAYERNGVTTPDGFPVYESASRRWPRALALRQPLAHRLRQGPRGRSRAGARPS